MKPRMLFMYVALVLLSLAFVGAEPMFVVIDDEDSINDLLPNLNQGNGIATLETGDAYPEDADANASIKVTGDVGDSQKFNPAIPNWQINITENPSGDDEFRFITFAWRKEGGQGIQLQLHATTDTWGHRYHAGVNVKGWNPSIEVSPDAPREWTVQTRDLVEDWGEMVITGIALSSTDKDFGVYDHIVFHQTEQDPLAFQAVSPGGKLATTWGKLRTPRF